MPFPTTTGFQSFGRYSCHSNNNLCDQSGELHQQQRGYEVCRRIFHFFVMGMRISSAEKNNYAQSFLGGTALLKSVIKDQKSGDMQTEILINFMPKNQQGETKYMQPNKSLGNKTSQLPGTDSDGFLVGSPQGRRCRVWPSKYPPAASTQHLYRTKSLSKQSWYSATGMSLSVLLMAVFKSSKL